MKNKLMKCARKKKKINRVNYWLSLQLLPFICYVFNIITSTLPPHKDNCWIEPRTHRKQTALVCHLSASSTVSPKRSNSAQSSLWTVKNSSDWQGSLCNIIKISVNEEKTLAWRLCYRRTTLVCWTTKNNFASFFKSLVYSISRLTICISVVAIQVGSNAAASQGPLGIDHPINWMC